MENEADDAARKKWELEARAQAEEMQQVGESSRKRPRGIGFLKANEDQMRDQNLNNLMSGIAGKERNAPTPKAGSSNVPPNAPPNAPTGPSAGPSRTPAPRAAAAITRAKSKTLFSEEDDSRIEELD